MTTTLAVTLEQMEQETLLPIVEVRDGLTDAPTVNTATNVMQNVAQCQVCGGFKREGLTRKLERFGAYTDVPVCDRCYEVLCNNVDLVTE